MSTPMLAAALAAEQSVTHQGSPLGASDAVLATPSLMPAAAAAAAPASHDQPCRTVTTNSSSTAAAPAGSATGGPAPITLPTWRCHWCRTSCAARVRLDFLRHSRSARHARRKGNPSYGHNP
ncbi:MAG: hypothetical protein ACRC2B_03060 [Rubrivivax sp.]